MGEVREILEQALEFLDPVERQGTGASLNNWATDTWFDGSYSDGWKMEPDQACSVGAVYLGRRLRDGLGLLIDGEVDGLMMCSTLLYDRSMHQAVALLAEQIDKIVTEEQAIPSAWESTYSPSAWESTYRDLYRSAGWEITDFIAGWPQGIDALLDRVTSWNDGAVSSSQVYDVFIAAIKTAVDRGL